MQPRIDKNDKLLFTIVLRRHSLLKCRKTRGKPPCRADEEPSETTSAGAECRSALSMNSNSVFQRTDADRQSVKVASQWTDAIRR